MNHEDVICNILPNTHVFCCWTKVHMINSNNILGKWKVQTLLFISLQWRQNERDSVSNHQPHDCLLNRLFRRRSKKTPKLRVTGLCAGNSPGTAQMASNVENVSIWWRHHVDSSFSITAYAEWNIYANQDSVAHSLTWTLFRYSLLSIFHIFSLFVSHNTDTGIIYNIYICIWTL